MKLKATAKINLALDVLGTRPDGYHEVRMIMQMVDMYDNIYLEVRKGQPGIELTTNLPYIPTDEHNLAFKAAKILMDEKGIREDGLSIRLDKFIPVAAGLAGGSSDAAAVMVGVNRLFRMEFSRKELMERAAGIGADVPYCVLRGTALSEGIGEVLTSLPDMPDCRILLCKPNINVSTRAVYEALDASPITDHPDTDGMIEAIRRGDLRGIVSEFCMKNVLEPVTKSRYPIIGAIEEDMMKKGALNAMMSGSGPTVFGIFNDKDKSNEAKMFLKDKYPSAKVFLTWPLRHRAGGSFKKSAGRNGITDKR